MKLWQQVIIGLILGIIAGLYLKEDAVNLKIFGTIFINLVKMVIVPLIFFVVLHLQSQILSYKHPMVL
mgnify:CR=1 FL=1